MNESAKLLEKAARAIEAAERLASEGFPEFAVGRAYYAMFHVAQAILAAKGLRYAKHGGVHAAFGEHVVKQGEMDPRFHRWLLDAFDRRVTADYGIDVVIDADEVARVMTRPRSSSRLGAACWGRHETSGSGMIATRCRGSAAPAPRNPRPRAMEPSEEVVVTSGPDWTFPHGRRAVGSRAG